MDTKIVKNQFQPKLAVVEYRQNGELIECDCYIPSIPGDDTFLKFVNLGELFYHVTDSTGKVECTNPNDTQEVYQVTFDQWYDDNRLKLHEELAEIINRKERRIDEMPDVFAKLQDILSPVKKSA